MGSRRGAACGVTWSLTWFLPNGEIRRAPGLTYHQAYCGGWNSKLPQHLSAWGRSHMRTPQAGERGDAPLSPVGIAAALLGRVGIGPTLLEASPDLVGLRVFQVTRGLRLEGSGRCHPRF